MSCCEFCIPFNSEFPAWQCTHASVLFSLIKVSILLKSGRCRQSSSQHIVISFNIWGFRSSNLLMSGLQDWPFWILLIISVIKRLAYITLCWRYWIHSNGLCDSLHVQRGFLQLKFKNVRQLQELHFSYTYSITIS